jgi:hypothetical protein
MKLTRSELIAIVMVELTEGKNGQELNDYFYKRFNEQEVVRAIQIREMIRRACGIAEGNFTYEDKFEILHIMREIEATYENHYYSNNLRT